MFSPFPPPSLVTGVTQLLIRELSSASGGIVLLTHEPEFASAVGLPECKVQGELRRIAAWIYRDHVVAEPSAAMEDFVGVMSGVMKDYFNGFRFVRSSESPPAMYNTQQCLSFFNMLAKHGVKRLADYKATLEAKGRLISVDELKGVFPGGVNINAQVS